MLMMMMMKRSGNLGCIIYYYYENQYILSINKQLVREQFISNDNPKMFR